MATSPWWKLTVRARDVVAKRKARKAANTPERKQVGGSTTPKPAPAEWVKARGYALVLRLQTVLDEYYVGTSSPNPPELATQLSQLVDAGC